MDVFDIGVSLMMAGNALDFMGSFVEKLGAAHLGVEKLQGQLENTRKLAMGVGAVFAGYEVFKGLLHLAEHGKELNHQQSMLLRNGIAYQDVIKETSRIYQTYTQQVPTASGPDFLRTANELVSVKGTLAGSDQALVQSLKIEGLIGNATGKSAEGQGYDFWRTVEDKGSIQNKEMTDRVLNALAQGTIATGGKIAGNDWYTYAKRAGTSWMGDSLDALPLQVMEMQTMTATGAGTARKTFANMMEGSQKLTKKQLAAWSQVGMLGSDALPVGHQTEQQRPDLFIQSIIDNLNKQGLDTFDKVKGWAAQAMNRKSSDYFMTAYSGMTERDPETGKTRLEKERTNLGRAQGLDQAYGTMMNTDMTANLSALNAQWHSFMEAVGGPLAKAMIPALQTATEVVNKMAAFADQHQTLTTMVGDLAAAGAGILTLSGGITALKAALAIKSALNNGTAATTVSGLGLDWSKGQAVPAAPLGLGSKLLGFAGQVLPPVIAYEAGKQAIDTGLDSLPHPAYPPGYDPKAMQDGGIAGTLGRLKVDVQPLLDAASAALKAGFANLGTLSAKDIEAAIGKLGTSIGAEFNKLKVDVQPWENAIKAQFANLGAGFKVDAQPLLLAAEGALSSSFSSIGATAKQDIQGGLAGVGAAFTAEFGKLPGQMSGAFSAAASGIAGEFKTAIGALPGEVAGAIGAAIGAIGSALAGALSHLNPLGPTGPSARQAAPTPSAAGGRYHGTSFEGAPPPARTTTAQVQTGRPQRVAMAMPPIIIENHNHTHLDGREIKHDVVRQLVADNERHNSVGGADWHGSYAPVGADMADEV